MIESRAEKIKEKKAESIGKIDEIAFPGQHAYWGGFSSCVPNTAIAAEHFLSMASEDFFRFYGPGLSDDQRKIAHAQLGALVEQGNALNLAIAKYNTNTITAFFYRLLPKELSTFLDTVKSMKGYENIKNLVVMADEAQCPKDQLAEYCDLVYDKFKKLALEKNDLVFFSGAAIHEILFFAKTRPTDGTTLYYVYDTSPARVLGGDKNSGSLEIHVNLKSAIESLTSRWTSFYQQDTTASIYAVTTIKRIKQLHSDIKYPPRQESFQTDSKKNTQTILPRA